MYINGKIIVNQLKSVKSLFSATILSPDNCNGLREQRTGKSGVLRVNNKPRRQCTWSMKTLETLNNDVIVFETNKLRCSGQVNFPNDSKLFSISKNNLQPIISLMNETSKNITQIQSASIREVKGHG